MKILITILIIVFSVTSAQYYFSLLGLDLEIDDYKSFPIDVTKDDYKIYKKKTSLRGFMPKKYITSIRDILNDNHFKCKKKTLFTEGFYETFYCQTKDAGDFSKLKLNFKLNDTTTITLTGDQLFDVKDNNYNFIFRGSGGTNILTIPMGKLDNNNNEENN